MYGLPLYRNGYCFIHLEDVPGMTAMVRPETVGMFTGVHVNGLYPAIAETVPLFEGDIVSTESEFAGDFVAAVLWRPGFTGFGIKPNSFAGEKYDLFPVKQDGGIWVDTGWTCVGNIHQNKELISKDLYNQILKLSK